MGLRRTKRATKPSWPFTCNANSQQAIGLVGWWPGSAPGGRRLLDESCNRKSLGILTGFDFTSTSGWVPGYEGGHALRFDGTDDYVDLGTHAIHLPPAGLTVSLWIKQHATPAAFDGIMGRTDGGWNYGYGMYWSSSSQMTFFVENYNVNFSTVTVPDPMRWNHMFGTWNGSSTLTTYCNGVQGATDTFAGPITGSYPLELGRLTSNTYNVNASIEDFRIYNRGFSIQQAWQIFRPRTRWELRYQPGIRRTFQVGGAGTQIITMPVITAEATATAPTATPGAATITPPVITAAATAIVPALTAGAITLTPPVITAAASAIVPLITAGTVTITPPVITAEATAIAPSVLVAGTLVPAVISADATAIAPTITGGAVTITVPVVTAAATAIPPTVIEQGTMVAPVVTSTATAIAPTISGGTATIVVPVITAAATATPPSFVVAGDQVIIIPVLSAAALALAPTIVGAQQPIGSGERFLKIRNRKRTIKIRKR